MFPTYALKLSSPPTTAESRPVFVVDGRSGTRRGHSVPRSSFTSTDGDLCFILIFSLHACVTSIDRPTLLCCLGQPVTVRIDTVQAVLALLAFLGTVRRPPPAASSLPRPARPSHHTSHYCLSKTSNGLLRHLHSSWRTSNHIPLPSNLWIQRCLSSNTVRACN
jgi:hypothetical protein